MPEHDLVLPIRLELEGSVWDRVKSVRARMADAVEVRISQMMRTLGVPGRPVAEINAQGTSSKWLTLRVGGQLCRYPVVLLNTARAYVAGTYRSPKSDPAELSKWIKDVFEQKPESAIASVAQVCEAIVELQPSVLIQNEQACAYIGDSGEESRPAVSQYGGTRLKAILREVVRRRCSLADVQSVKQALRDNAGNDAAAVEEIIAAAGKERIEIRSGTELHASLVNAGREKELVSFARDGLYEELGVLYPRIALVEDASLLPAAFRFRIGSLDTIPHVSLGTHEILVNDTSERLALMGVQAAPTINIATDQPASIVDASQRDMLEAAGLTVWNQWEYVILALAEALRQNAACFVNSGFTSMQLRRLARDYPKIVDLSNRQINVKVLTGILRRLAEERISIRDLRLILERLVDCPYANDPLGRYLVLDDRLTINEKSMMPVADSVEWKVEFVRAGLRAQVAHIFSRRTDTVVVYLLSEEIENLLVQGSDGEGALLDEANSSRILEAIHAELAYLPPTALMPSFLTRGAARPKLRQLLQYELPRVSVIAHEELPRDLNVQPVGRISLSA